MTTTFLSILVLILAAVQPSHERAFVAICYAAISLGHLALVSWWADGFSYYLTAALADVAIMWLIVRSVKIPAIAISLLRVCLAEIVVNAAGWALWWLYYEPGLYNALYQCLQVWVIAILMRKDRADEIGGYFVDRWGDYLRLVINPGRFALSRRGSSTWN